MMLKSLTSASVMWSVLGIGVAVSVKTSTSFFSSLSRSLSFTPKRCSSSITTRPMSLNSTSFCKSEEMLLGKHRGRHKNRDLLIVEHRPESGPHRHLRLSVAHVPAYEPVHGFGFAHILHHILYCLLLVRCFIVFKSCGKFGKEFPRP